MFGSMNHVYNPDRHHRRSIRLKGYDYASPGAYFVTMCSYEKECIFGEVADGSVRLNEIGKLVEQTWLATPTIRPNVSLDEYVVMPNHLHGIVIIDWEMRFDPVARRGVLQYAPTVNELQSPSQTLGAIIRGFEGSGTKRINAMRGAPGTPVWQRNYYEHIVRNDKDLDRIREYIHRNTDKWSYSRHC
jgi:REP element-mobilizing transposase RayT